MSPTITVLMWAWFAFSFLVACGGAMLTILNGFNPASDRTDYLFTVALFVVGAASLVAWGLVQ